MVAWKIEKDPDAIVHRYDLLKNFLYNEIYIHDQVAGAVQQSHRNLSLEIYGDLAQKQIAKVKPAAYAYAAIHLRKMKTIYEINDRMSERTKLIQSIRTPHKAKRSLMEILNMMEA